MFQFLGLHCGFLCPFKIALYVILHGRVSSERTLAAFKKIPSPLSLSLSSASDFIHLSFHFLFLHPQPCCLSAWGAFQPLLAKSSPLISPLIHPCVSSTHLYSMCSQRRARFCSSCRKACFSISFLNSPCLLPSSSMCWPHSATRRWSSTATAFAFWIVERR